MSVRLSIIIPFYNVEQYIAECLDSVYQQDIPEEEYEVICVNDASPDHSRDIVLEYKKKHSNLVLVEHEVNKKLGAARNTGRRIARGRYIWNVDSDDKIIPNCLGKMLEMCEDNDLDILSFGFVIFSEKEKKFVARGDVDRGVCDGQCFVKNYGVKRLSELCPVWKQLYRKEFLDSHGVYSPEINMGEDVPYSFKSLFLAKRMVYCNDICYQYRLRRNALTDSEIKHFPPVVLFEKSIVNAKTILDVVVAVPDLDVEIREEVMNVARHVASLWDKYYHCFSDSEKKTFKKICRKNILSILAIRKLYSKRKLFKLISIII